jgi:hypothetical protein
MKFFNAPYKILASPPLSLPHPHTYCTVHREKHVDYPQKRKQLEEVSGCKIQCPFNDAIFNVLQSCVGTFHGAVESLRK